MLQSTLKGSFVAIVTPFRGDAVDVDAFRALIERQITAGTAGLVVCGTTGEAATLDADEYATVLRTAVDQVAGRVPVIAGTGSNATAATIERTRAAAELGVDAALVVVPYYNKPTQAGLYAHFEAVARDGGLPVVLYDVPSRTGRSLDIATVLRLAELEGVVAIKEATGDLDRITEILAGTGGTFPILSGEDALTMPMVALGAHGMISVTANVAPAECAAMVAAAAEGRLEEARALHQRLYPLTRAMFLETNPIPVKRALAQLGLIAEEFRLPLLPMGESRIEVDRIVKEFA